MGFKLFISAVISFCVLSQPANAGSFKAAKDALVPHKALYDINLVATRSGSQIVNISGQMFYEWHPTCEAWVTDHRFSLFYEYADSPGMRINSDFTTYETFDGTEFNYSARRSRDGELYEELRGRAEIGNKAGEAIFSMPEGLTYAMPKDAVFPMIHTARMVEKASANQKFFRAVVFDGSDKDGPVEINTFIGKEVNPMNIVKANEELDMSLINSKAWKARMAVFPIESQEEFADYEMSLVFHENGLISDMLIEYDDFSVTQELVALEKLDVASCEAKKSQKN